MQEELKRDGTDGQSVWKSDQIRIHILRRDKEEVMAIIEIIGEMIMWALIHKLFNKNNNQEEAVI